MRVKRVTLRVSEVHPHRPSSYVVFYLIIEIIEIGSLVPYATSARWATGTG